MEQIRVVIEMQPRGVPLPAGSMTTKWLATASWMSSKISIFTSHGNAMGTPTSLTTWIAATKFGMSALH